MRGYSTVGRSSPWTGQAVWKAENGKIREWVDERARVVPKAVANGTTSAGVEIKRSAMVDQAGRHRRPA